LFEEERLVEGYNRHRNLGRVNVIFVAIKNDEYFQKVFANRSADALATRFRRLKRRNEVLFPNGDAVLVLANPADVNNLVPADFHDNLLGVAAADNNLVLADVHDNLLGVAAADDNLVPPAFGNEEVEHVAPRANWSLFEEERLVEGYNRHRNLGRVNVIFEAIKNDDDFQEVFANRSADALATRFRRLKRRKEVVFPNGDAVLVLANPADVNNLVPADVHDNLLGVAAADNNLVLADVHDNLLGVAAADDNLVPPAFGNAEDGCFSPTSR
jgi:predicted NAD-dependent protein-ADP-ribosyltransferase YbiA (DUF1768 family)